MKCLKFTLFSLLLLISLNGSADTDGNQLSEVGEASDQSTLSVIAAVAGLIGATGGLFSAIAAFLSAGTARDAANRAQKVELRQLVREVILAAEYTIAETMRVTDICDRLDKNYRHLATFSGQFSGSRRKLLTEGVEEKRKAVGPLQEQALRLVEDKNTLRDLDETELTDELLKYEGYVIQVRRVKEKLEHDLSTVEREIQPYHEKAIKGNQ